MASKLQDRSRQIRTAAQGVSRRLPPANLRGNPVAELATVFLILIPLVAAAVVVSASGTRVANRVLDPYFRAPLPKARVAPRTTFVYDRNGDLLTTLHAGVNRVPISFGQMPEHLKEAVIAAEDKDFYRHEGLDYQAIVRAALADFRNRALEQGGSTITQQYVKNVYTGGKRSLRRKLREAIIATRLEQRFTKNQILEKYLNSVYFGAGAYGVEAAAQTYFGRPAKDLNVDQSATLAGLIPAPARFTPKKSLKVARTRRNFVLDSMAEQGYISPRKATRLKRKPLEIVETKRTITQSSYFAQYVTNGLVKKYGYKRTFEGGLRVRTTLDPRMQRAAENAVLQNLPSPNDPAAAVVAIEPTTGAIRAMVGGRDFSKKKFNLAVQAHRQTGSAFKTFTLVAAMEKKISPRSTWKGPAKTVIDDPRCFGPEGAWDPENYGDSSAGTMDLVRATANSVNTIFAQLVVEVGPDQVADVAKRMGIRSKLQEVCSITLGSQAVTPLEMTAANATLAARGIRHKPTAVFEVKNGRGKTVDRADYKGKRALDQNDADMANYILQSVVTSGTGTAANIGRPVAGKTGTAQDYVDAWFCGYVPQLAACVWVGYPKAEIPMHYVQGVPNVYGGSIPAAIWHDFMSVATANMPVESFFAPDFSEYTYFPPGTVPKKEEDDEKKKKKKKQPLAAVSTSTSSGGSSGSGPSAKGTKKCTGPPKKCNQP
ncbi:MAG TPA: PBP1A family penicillin-binding protein [Actinomycetota bacterium]|nr:PBP1A family penicillin-binding protein [Actinomycetota bacterium]